MTVFAPKKFSILIVAGEYYENVRYIDLENYGDIIKKLRVNMGLTQKEVAEDLGVTPGYICNVENGRTAMSLKVLMYYAKLMNLSLDSLVGMLEPSYKTTALDREAMELIAKLDDEGKKKVIDTLKIWVK